jgi:hypothetical protein
MDAQHCTVCYSNSSLLPSQVNEIVRTPLGVKVSVIGVK